jgi:hypothetical protein
MGEIYDINDSIVIIDGVYQPVVAYSEFKKS